MIEIKDKEFNGFYDNRIGTLYENFHLVKCSFNSCRLSFNMESNNRSIIRNTKISNCIQKNCIINCAILENIEINGLKTKSLLQIWGALFNQVRFIGKIGRIMISDKLIAGTAPKDIQDNYDKNKKEYYENISYAIDISKAEFKECGIRNIPARLIKRDPISQVIITRESVFNEEWKNLDLSGTYFATAIKLFLSRNEEDYVLIAPKQDKNYAIFQDKIDLLVKEGFARR